MKIIITADPELPVPPALYGGIERIIELLVIGLTRLRHEVVLFAHKNSAVPCELVPYPSASQNKAGIIRNAYALNRYMLSHRADIIHSFGRLAYLLPQLPLKIPKLMSYQREPTISQVKKAVRLSAANTLAFTGCSNYITGQLMPYARAYTVYNGINLDKYQPATVVPADAPLVFLGRIEPVKGTHHAISVARQAGRRLVIAGNIPAAHQTYFDSQVKPFLSSTITYIGPVDDGQKNKLLQNASALLMPVEWDEPFGIVMIEAMACGTPVLGFKRGAVPEVVTQGKTGFYTGTVQELAAKVELIPSLNRQTVRQETEKRFSAPVIVNEYLNVYQQLLQVQ